MHLWSRKHFEMTLDTIYHLGRWEYMEDFLNQPVAQNIFLLMTEDEKLKLVKDIYAKLSQY